LLKDDVIPQFSPDDFAAIAIHNYPEATGPGVHVQAFGLPFQIGLDYESEQLRRYRLPNHVFPLNVVFDADGEIIHVGTELDDAVAAVEAELGG
jgi:hypothetical protein